LSISSVKCIDSFFFGEGSFQNIKKIIEERQKLHKISGLSELFIFYFDAYFKNNSEIITKCKSINNVEIKFIDSSKEPTTSLINNLRDELIILPELPSGLVAVGGGNTLDTVKAVSNLLNNIGNAEDYQGWDLVKYPGVYKIGIPTVSGTGAESSRTCVLINEKTGLKLGMNSDFTMFDSLILDPDLTASVPKDIFFYTISDAFFHSMEPLSGKLRNPIADSYAFMAKKLCEEIFLLDNIQSSTGRSKAMLASYFGGIAIANSMTALVHPFSAGLSVVLKTPHTLANCLVLMAMEEFYPTEREIILNAAEKHQIAFPSGLCSHLDDAQFNSLYESSIVHEKPLINGLGKDFKKILTREKVREIFERI
jgi:3-deoxy-alpha-D-manno-octulosonate 8-oxidase